MDIIVSHERGRVPVTVLRIKGALAMSDHELLQAQAQEAYEAGTRSMLLDLTDVTYLSSSGLRTIHQIFDLLRTDSPAESNSAIREGLKDGTFKSSHLKLLRPSRTVLRTLELAGYDMFLEIHTDMRNAIASF